MKALRAMFVVVLMISVAGCSIFAEPKNPTSSAVSMVPAAKAYSIVKDPDQTATVFVLVDEDGYQQFAQATGRTAPTEKDPVGMDMSRKQAVMVLGDQKTTDLDGKLTVDGAVKAKYWLTTDGRVAALLQSLR